MMFIEFNQYKWYSIRNIFVAIGLEDPVSHAVRPSTN